MVFKSHFAQVIYDYRWNSSLAYAFLIHVNDENQPRVLLQGYGSRY